jgi:hypothetical protein
VLEKSCRNCSNQLRGQLNYRFTLNPPVDAPSPTTVLIETANSVAALGWTWISRPAQGRVGWVFLSQSHLIFKAHPMTSKLWIPRPPSSGARQTRCHPTRQCPPFMSLHPFHRNPRRIFFYCLDNPLRTMQCNLNITLEPGIEWSKSSKQLWYQRIGTLINGFLSFTSQCCCPGKSMEYALVVLST